MSREWKPGDVAIWRGQFWTSVALYVSGCTSGPHEDGPHWHLDRGGWASRNSKNIRPLVVIDPEDDAQMEEVTKALLGFGGTDFFTDHIRKVLRSLVEPPTPDEPTGKYAEVEVTDGRTWYRDPCGKWRRTDDPGAWAITWDRLDVARIVSEGVS